MSRRPTRRGGPKHARRTPFAVVITALVLGGLALLLALNTAAAANELRRHALASRDQAIAAAVAQLRNDIAASAAPGNLASAAAELGMVPAANPAFLVDVGRHYVVRGKPAPVPEPVIPLPTSTASKRTPAQSTSAQPKPGRTTAASTTAARPGHSTSPARSALPSRQRTPTPSSPSPTPTPTVTLPGGPR